MASATHVRLCTAAAAALACVSSSWAQQGGTSTVTITGRGLGTASVAGFGSAPPARSPLQASVFGQAQLNDVGIAQLNGLTRVDASTGDAYNAEGYWSILSVRGFTLDNRFNYRREGLPINAETAIALNNKERVELVKGTSGIQAGTSAPGGLVNLVVKRPTGSLRNARIEVRQTGSVLAAIDISERFGNENRFGLRLNAAVEHLDPIVRDTRGSRSLWALAADWQFTPDTLLQAEIESSRQDQPSVAGFSMLGDVVPSASSIDPRRNLNSQPWRQNVVLDGNTASMRLQQRLGDDWRLTAQAQQQRLKSDDRTAFPYGVYDANYNCTQWCDRFAPDGSFTYWQFVSDNERRTTTALAFTLSGQARTGAVQHGIETGVLRSRYRGQFQDQIFDIAGTGRIDGSLITPPSPGFPDANTQRDERSTEWFVRDAMRLGEVWQLWAGVRHTRMDRSSVRTSADSDGSMRATRYERNATTPWLAVAAQISSKTMVYASWGRGLETDVAPNRARYSNPGASLELESRQFEVGIKHGTEQVEAAITLFDIDRGQTADLGTCAGTATCTRVIDGSARHRGVEAQWTQVLEDWTLQGSAMLLHAERRGSQQTGVNGNRPVNVPHASLRMSAEYQLVAGLALQASLSAEGNRVMLPYDTSVRIAGWSRLDLGARWKQSWNGHSLVWRLGLDNATDRRVWKESPYQFGHVYLYPLAPRTWRGSIQVSF